MTFRERVLSTMKSADTESKFELYVTRTPGYLWALFFRSLHTHPITVTLLSIVIGAASGWFFYFDDLKMNVIGMVLLIWANWYDCADGQLARMTGQKTLIGRILDGFGGDVWFFSIYFFISLRLTPEWGIWIWLLAAWAGFHCHARQCAIADYYRNIHLWFLLGESGSELDRSDKLQEEMRALRWNLKDWFHKLYLFFYARYTRSQERQSPHFQKLYAVIQQKYDGRLEDGDKEWFLSQSRPLMPLSNILNFDTRVAALFISLFLGHPWLYCAFEAVVLESLRYYTIRRHEKLSQAMLTKLTSTHD